MPAIYVADILLLITLPLLLVVSAFFSGSETALFSLTRHHLLRLKQSRSLAGGIIVTLLGETRGLLITLLLGNMTVNVLYFALSTLLLLRLGHNDGVPRWFIVILSVVPLLAMILLGEVLPKLLAAHIAATWSRLCALPLLLIHRFIGPLRHGVNLLVVTPLARLIAPRRKPAALSAAELDTLFDLSKDHGVIDHDEEELLGQVLELNQIKVSELMTPRVDMKTFDLNDRPQKLIETIRSTRLSHIPVYDEDIDRITGVIYARQALLKPIETSDDVRALVRQVKFVPEQQRADRLLVELRKTGTTFAIVVDEYGGTAGLATLEDVVEHMVGEIPGPYDRTMQGPTVEHISEDLWRTDSDLPIRDWEEAFAAGWPLQHSEGHGITTLGGLVMAQLGRLPRVGDHIQLGNVAIEVESMQRRRIKTLLVRLLPAAGDDEGDTRP